jgi:hypothetical protein
MEGFWRVKETYYRKAANVRLRFANRTYGPHLFKDLKGDLGDIARWMIEKHPMASMVNKTL